MVYQKIAVKVFMLFFLLFFISTQAWALIDMPDMFNFDFRFNNPGARANAMGGAFIGLADDATAAYANPAGLTILTKPEISIEYKYGEHEEYFYAPVVGGDTTYFDYNVQGVSFLSFVYPANKATFTIYRHELINIESDYTHRYLPFSVWEKAKNHLNVTTYGLAMGLKFTNSFSAGLSVGFSQLDWCYLRQEFTNPSLSQPAFSTHTIDSEDVADQFSVSLMWNPFGEFNIGLIYRYGPTFETLYKWEYDSNLDGIYDQTYNTPNTLNIPDVYGFGMSYRFLSSLTVAADLNYVKYSDILDNFSTGYGTQTSNFEVDDGFEIHTGFEYVFTTTDIPFAVRGGYYYRPKHRIYYTGPTAVNPLLREKGEDEHIFSLGFGAVFENIQVDVAGSWGDYISEYTLSFVYRFE